MIRFLSLGSGSSGNCYYLSTGETSILIDAGVGIRTLKKHLRDYSIPFESIDGVFITHDHADHIKAVGQLANDYGIMLYSTQTVLEGIKRNYCVTNKPRSEQQTAIKKNNPVSVGDLEIMAFAVPHDSSDSVGYRVKCGDLVFCLITDIGAVTPEIQQMVSEANYLVVESNYDNYMLMNGKYPAQLKGRIRGGKGHLSNALCAELLAEHATPNLRHVWLCHLSEENNHPELARKTVTTKLKEYGIVIGVEFQLEVLRRKSPSQIYELE